jgi:dienelactone hydrolase
MSSGKAPISDLTGWKQSPFAAAGLTHDCYEKGTGPGVIVIPEIPGITPAVLGFADHLVGRGFAVLIPSPFGVPGRTDTNGYQTGVILRMCVSSEFRAFATNARRPFADYIRALARDLAARTPGPGVGVIGMCFTGGFALAAAVDASVLAPVLSQPAVPFPVSGAHRRDPGVSEDELAQVAARTADGGLCLLGLRFSGDATSPRDRFTALSERLGDAFEVIELDSSAGNEGGFGRRAHSVLTREARDVPGHPTSTARDQVVAFLRERLEPVVE